MTVQELLKDVDMNAIANIYDSRLEDWEREIMAPKDVFRQHMEEFVQMLLTLTPDENADPDSDYSGGYVMAPMPYLYIDDETGTGEVRIEADYIRKAD